MVRRGFIDLLVIPWVDKTIAIVASLPFVVLPARRSRSAASHHHCLDGAADSSRSCNPNPWFWLLAFVTT
jgi:hypothetical protein